MNCKLMKEMVVIIMMINLEDNNNFIFKELGVLKEEALQTGV